MPARCGVVRPDDMKPNVPDRPAWIPVVPADRVVRARPDGLWTLVKDFVDGPLLLRIKAPADKTWAYADSAQAKCGPDGDQNALLAPAKCLMPNAPVGALIGKIGGSTAGAHDAEIFLVGNHCVVRVPDGGGPLYLTINDEAAGMGNNAGSVEISSLETLASAVPATTNWAAYCALLADLAKLADRLGPG